MSGKELAEKTGLAAPYISQLETEQREGTVETLKKIAAALHVDIDDIVQAACASPQSEKITNTISVAEKMLVQTTTAMNRRSMICMVLDPHSSYWRQLYDTSIASWRKRTNLRPANVAKAVVYYRRFGGFVQVLLSCAGRADDRQGDQWRYDLLEAKCNKCDRVSLVPLRALRQPKETPIWKLEAALYCEPCSERRHRSRRQRASMPKRHGWLLDSSIRSIADARHCPPCSSDETFVFEIPAYRGAIDLQWHPTSSRYPTISQSAEKHI
jgi:transcriptional regulator with XRE-family HTH domain